MRVALLFYSLCHACALLVVHVVPPPVRPLAAAAMSLFLLCLAGAVVFYLIVYYNVFRGGRCATSAKLTGKTAIVTGGLFGTFCCFVCQKTTTACVVMFRRQIRDVSP